MPVLSPSQKKDLRCPHRWRRKKIDGVKEDFSRPAQVGVLVHGMMARYYDVCQKGKSELLTQGDTRSIAENPAGESAPDIAEEARDIFLDARKPPLHAERFLGVEVEAAVRRKDGQPPTFTDYWDPTAVLRGRLDAAWFDGKVCKVTDWTTAWNVDKSAQLADYAILALGRAPTLEAVQLETRFLRFNSSVREEVSRAQIVDEFWPRHLRIFDRLARMLEKIKVEDPATVFAAVAGPQCSYCKLDCPLEDPERMDFEANPLDLAARYLVMRGRVKRAEQLLRGRVSQEGPLVGDNFRLEFKPTAGKEWRAREVLEALPEEIRRVVDLGITNKTVEGLMKKYPSLKDILVTLAHEKAGSRWTVGTS